MKTYLQAVEVEELRRVTVLHDSVESDLQQLGEQLHGKVFPANTPLMAAAD